MRDPEKYNSSGCKDMTAYKAIKHIENEEKSEIRVHKLLKQIFRLCEAYGFHLECRLVLRDTKTGKIWR